MVTAIKAKTEQELSDFLSSIFEYLVQHMDDKLKDLLLGEIWIDMPFDWHDYK